MKIANKITLFFVTTVMLVAAVAVPVVYYTAKSNITNLASSALIGIADSRVKHIETFLKLHKDMAESLSSSTEFRELLLVGKNDNNYAARLVGTINELESIFVQDKANLEIFILNPHGIVVVSTDKKNIGVDKSSDAYFLNAIEKSYINGPYYSSTLKQPALTFSAPIFDIYSGNLLGVIVIRNDVSELFDITTGTIGLGKTGEIMLFNKYFFMISPSRFAPQLLFKYRLNIENAKHCLVSKDNNAAKDCIIGLNYYRDKPTISYTTYLPSVKWWLISKMDIQEAFASLYQATLLMLASVFSMFIFIVFVGNYLALKITKPIEVLHHGTEIIGEGNLDFKVGTQAKDEIGQLSRAFDQMTDKMKYTTVSLDKLNKEISQRKKAEQELNKAYEQLKAVQAQMVQSAKMASVGLLAGGVAHEINNPLTGVLNNVQLIKMMAEQKKEFSMDEFKELLGFIEESAKRCTKITRSLLDFSHTSKGIFQNVLLNEIIEKVMLLTEHELQLRNITVELGIDSSLPQIKGDPQLLKQAVFDIISNARWAIEKKSGKEGGTIIIKIKNHPETKSEFFSITDTGIGIPKENLGRLFEPFFTTKEVGEGTGLGLSIVYNIIKEHNGTITVESQEGFGTTFKIVFPALA